MTRETAETIGLKALAFLAESPDGLARFMELSGLDPAQIRARAAEPQFLSFILSWLLGEEALLMAFCERETIGARNIHLAQHVLDDA